MSLIAIFTDHVINRKSLKDYVEIRKTLNERGEFNDQKLLDAEEKLQALKKEDPQTYELMYDVLAEVFKRDRGHQVEYPIDFIKAVLQINKNGKTAKEVYREYKRSLDHHYNDA
jgi:hypothetical protein